MKANCLIGTLLLVLSVGAGTAFSQGGTTGTIAGTVQDSTGAVIPGATVTVRNVETGISRTVTTDAAGKYRAQQLGLGNYEVTAETPGFQTSVRTGITLTVGREAAVDFSMQVGAVAEKITVTGEAPLIETTNATVASLVDEKTMRELPLSGRNFTDLTAIQPGAIFVTTVTPSVRTGGGRKISMDGARPNQTLYMMDGIETMNVATNMAPSSVLGRQLGTEAVREFNVLSKNYGAQYGRAIGGVVNSVTLSGTNDWHGGFYHFFRNDALDANDFFVPTDAPKIPLKQNQFGSSFGGPIQRDKTFFFLNYEGERRREGISDFTAFMDDDAREGLITDPAFPTGTWKTNPKVILQDFRPIHRWTQAVIRDLAERCKPGAERLGGGRCRYASSRTNRATENYGMVRMDRQLSDSDSLFGRLTVDYSDDFQLDLGNNPDFTHVSDGHYYMAALQYTRILSPTMLNVASVGFTRTKMAQLFTVPEKRDPILDCIPGQPLCIGPSPGGAGVSGIHGADLSLPFRLIDNAFTYQEQVTINRGNHSIAAGAEVKRYQMNEFQNIWFSGQMRWSGGFGPWFKGTPDFITGPIPQSENPIIPPDVYRGYRQTLVGLYFQDDFRVVPNFTVNLGLRWEHMTDPSEVNNKAGSVRDVLRDSGFTLGKVFEINSGWKGLSPRVGFAWTPFGGGGTVLRGGVGVFTEWPLSYLYTLSSYVAPFADRIQRNLPPMPFPMQGLRPGDPAFASSRDPIINDFDWHPAYTYQYNLGLEQQLGQAYVVRAAYVGSRSLHLTGNANPIAPLLKEDQNGRLYTPGDGRPVNPNFGSFRYITSGGNSWYNALQLTGERRFSAGLAFRVSLNWSKNIDTTALGQQTADSSSAISTTNYYNRRADKGLSSLDNRRNMIFNFNYEVPVGAGRKFGSNLAGWLDQVIGGWQLNGVLSVRDGLPLNASMGFRCSGNGVSSNNTDRPDLRAGASNNPVIEGKRDFRQEDKYYDIKAFVAPPNCFTTPAATDLPNRRGYFGNAGRNTLIGPGLVGTDFSIFKNFAVGEGKSLQFRAETFNLLNRPNFRLDSDGASSLSGARSSSNPDGRYNATGGVISNLGAGSTMRQIQLALKFIF